MKTNKSPKNEVKVRSFYADCEGIWYMIYCYPESNEPSRSYRLILESYMYPTVAILQEFANQKLNLDPEEYIHVGEILNKVDQSLRSSTTRPVHHMTNSNDKSKKQKIATAELDYLIFLIGIS
jgi:hypothetical protein